MEFYGMIVVIVISIVTVLAIGYVAKRFCCDHRDRPIPDPSHSAINSIDEIFESAIPPYQSIVTPYDSVVPIQTVVVSFGTLSIKGVDSERYTRNPTTEKGSVKLSSKTGGAKSRKRRSFS